MDNLILATTCVLGLFVGGSLGGFGMALLQGIQTGRIRLPPYVALGPIKLDLTGLSPQASAYAGQTDLPSVAPLLEGGGSLTGGCLAVISAGMVLVGFILPWFTCNLTLLSGSFSGLSALIQLLFGLILTLVGTAGSNSSNLNTIGGILFMFLLGITVAIALTPLMGWRIGRQGLNLIQALRTSNVQRRIIAQTITRAATIGLAPLLCYFSVAVTNLNLPVVPGLGSSIQLRSADIGLWLTMSGFGLAFIAGLVISTAASLAEQLPKRPATNPRPPLPQASPPPPAAEAYPQPPANYTPQPPIAQPVPVITCPQCGNLAEPGNAFCIKCGTKL